VAFVEVTREVFERYFDILEEGTEWVRVDCLTEMRGDRCPCLWLCVSGTGLPHIGGVWKQ